MKKKKNKKAEEYENIITYRQWNLNNPLDYKKLYEDLLAENDEMDEKYDELSILNDALKKENEDAETEIVRLTEELDITKSFVDKLISALSTKS
tara:strand:- start:237 stop:518 length:282 start_codon:yes stop_codon:yes gene_type:complete